MARLRLGSWSSIIAMARPYCDSAESISFLSFSCFWATFWFPLSRPHSCWLKTGRPTRLKISSNGGVARSDSGRAAPGGGCSRKPPEVPPCPRGDSILSERIFLIHITPRANVAGVPQTNICGVSAQKPGEHFPRLRPRNPKSSRLQVICCRVLYTIRIYMQNSSWKTIFFGSILTKRE